LTENKSVSKKKITLLDFFVVLFKFRRFISIFTIATLILSAVVYFFVLDLIYFSSASIKSSGKNKGLLSSIEGIADFGGLEDFGIGGGAASAKELAAYEEILMSRRCLEALIVKFDLMNRDEHQFMEEAIKDFKENKLLIEPAKLSGVLYIGVSYKDPILAKEMVDFLLTELNKINVELNVTTAKNNREFIENRYNQAKQDLANVEDSLKSFQLIYGIAPDLQIKASAQSVFTLEAELKAEEVKLDVVRKILSPDQPEVKLQESKVNSLKSKISEITTSTDLDDFLRLGNSPQIAMSYLRLQRNLEIQTKILTFLLPVYEQAKIEEKRETPTIIVLDKPYVAEKKSKPKRFTMTMIFTFIGFVVAFSISLLYEFTLRNSIKENLIAKMNLLKSPK